jgi:chromosome segregation ATPase
MRLQLEESEKEKSELEERLKDLMSEPFLKRETGESTKMRLEKVELTLTEKEKYIRTLKEKMIKEDKAMTELQEELKTTQEKRDAFKRELEEMREKYEGDGKMNIDTVQKQLFKLDPSAYRQTMQDLNYTGSDPLWTRINFIDMADTGETREVDPNDPESLIKEIDRLK